ncbi:AAA family ATPase [Patescibacteria group bacterium]|nr:MAG: AAA family ATPase [Patescibacteria group bacterium]
MIITLSGLPGSGKSTVAKMLAQKLGYRFFSMGDLRGKAALERGLTIDEFNALPENTDIIVDDYQKKLGETEDDLVIDGRISWHFIPKSFKVFLDVDPDVGADRIFAGKRGANRGDEPEYRDAAHVRETLAARVASDTERYKKHYGIDFGDRSVYDLVIDTSSQIPEETADAILAALPAQG